MIVWTPQFSPHKRLVGYLRLMLARHRYFDHFAIRHNGGLQFEIAKVRGYRYCLRRLYNRYRGRRCFLIGNGPSLKKMALERLKDEVTIGVNAIYKHFPQMGFTTNFLLFEDVEQTELRAHEIPRIKGPVKILSLYNAYAIKSPGPDMLFANVRGADKIYWEEEAPMFSTDFAHIVYLGANVCYLGLQLAYYLGCNPVYLIGVDHSMKELRRHFPPGKMRITAENYELIKRYHFSDNYYRIGDLIGIPHFELQEQAFGKARDVYEDNGRRVYNAGVDSLLDVFETVDFESLF